MLVLPITLATLLGYLLGALPFGWLIARRHGVDIFREGSGNPGATNVRRVLGEKFGPAGKRAGNLVFGLDAAKGALAAGWPIFLTGWMAARHTLTGGSYADWALRSGDAVLLSTAAAPYAAIGGLVGALVGHSFSCFTRFKGGKGVATSAGGLVVLLPLPTLLGLAAWLLVFRVSRYVSLASVLAAVVLPATAFLLNSPRPLAWLAAVLGVFVIVRHRSNLQRLVKGTEHKFTPKPSLPDSSP